MSIFVSLKEKAKYRIRDVRSRNEIIEHVADSH